MNIIICYDISTKKNGIKRTQKVSAICMKYGYRIQKSVFLCQINKNIIKELKIKIENCIHKEYDSVLFLNAECYSDIGVSIKIKNDNIII